MNRIPPLVAPFDPDVDEALAMMMPPGMAPIALFRTLARNVPMTRAMHGWGSYELSRQLSISLRQRELVIDRVTARCRCEYEWGVHVAYFAERAGLSEAQLASLTHGAPSDTCWTDPAERALLRLVDSLHDTADVDDPVWIEAQAHFDADQLLDVVLLAGWYHAISFVANAARVPLETGAPRFADVGSGGAGASHPSTSVEGPGTFDAMIIEPKGLVHTRQRSTMSDSSAASTAKPPAATRSC